MLNRKNILIATLGLVLLGTSCKKDDDDKVVESSENGYTVALRIPAGDGTADYILNVESLMEGTISSSGQGLEQLGWRSYGATTNSVLSVGYYEDNHVVGYEYSESGDLVEKGKFQFGNTLDILSETETDNEMIGVEIPRKGATKRTFQRVDPDGLSILERKEHIIYELSSNSTVAQPTALIVRDGKLFVPFYMLSQDGTFSTPKTDTSYVAVYSYPGLAFEKVIKDTRMGPMGIYGNDDGLIKADNGDLYGYSAAAAACGFTTQDKKSGILRIKNGETDFDDSYFYDFEAASGKKINWMEYVGDGKAIAKIFTDKTDPTWAVFKHTEPIMDLVLIDLENKSYQKVTGVPMHSGQYNTHAFLEDGKAYMSITTTTEAAIYQIDLATAVGTKGAVIDGVEAPLISKF